MEEWRPIRQYNGYYEVSNFGAVRSVDRCVVKSNGVSQSRRGKPHRVFLDGDGYIRTKLNKDGVSKVYLVHRLVYETYMGDIPDGFDIDHIDNDRQNNNVNNLQAIPHKDNVLKSIDQHRHVCTKDVYNGSSNPNYGNHILSERYRNDPKLSKIKQSRPGARNGRAKQVVLIEPNGCEMHFDYIEECAKYCLDAGIFAGKINSIATKLSKMAKVDSVRSGYRIRFA